MCWMTSITVDLVMVTDIIVTLKTAPSKKLFGYTDFQGFNYLKHHEEYYAPSFL